MSIWIATTLSIPIVGHANWSILNLSYSDNPLYFPNAINDSGRIVGRTIVDNDYHAFITGPNGVGVTDLTESMKISSAVDINNSGQVVGQSEGHPNHVIITGPDAMGVTHLSAFGGSNPYGTAINDSGQVAATFKTSTGETHTVVTGPNGDGFTDIGTLGGGFITGSGINNSGQIAGTAFLSGDTHGHAYITGTNGVGLTDLGTLTPDLNSSGRSINDSGQIIGSADISGGTSHAFVTGENGSNMMDLGTLGGQFSDAMAINNLGEVVGISTTVDDGYWNSFLYSHGGITHLDLLAPVVEAGWSNLQVSDINNNGQIVGNGMHNGVHTGFLLSYTSDTIFNPDPIFIPVVPVPEPETYAMFLAGLGLIGFMTSRKKRRSA